MHSFLRRSRARILVTAFLALTTLGFPALTAPASAGERRPPVDSSAQSWRIPLRDRTGVGTAVPTNARLSLAPAVGGTRPPWLPCGLNDPRTKIIKTYVRASSRSTDGTVFPSGVATLRCGDTKYGYRHIVLRHRDEWRTNAARSEDVWLDLADFSITAALTDPDRVTYDPRNDAFCFSREIYLVNNRTGQRVGYLIPNVVVGFGTLDVVTAIPKKEQCRRP
jgi:hypothetical protein